MTDLEVRTPLTATSCLRILMPFCLTYVPVDSDPPYRSIQVRYGHRLIFFSRVPLVAFCASDSDCHPECQSQWVELRESESELGLADLI